MRKELVGGNNEGLIRGRHRRTPITTKNLHVALKACAVPVGLISSDDLGAGQIVAPDIVASFDCTNLALQQVVAGRLSAQRLEGQEVVASAAAVVADFAACLLRVWSAASSQPTPRCACCGSRVVCSKRCRPTA